ncbi:crossover junction endodeoxyribonuclease RuvC [Candidatus Kinetoplastibacterium blastocrithidii TCC012E]|uniref:Crossover junction endodeoxyribonuclease RuvC n=1 Tax=Candidatus Kinetoplastidibacterium blastocrithidiae TCC012E TaxID=1208922 RepID=M1M107_9PROT|nr:crossover junction endodeoxyribonuclease RuvC [Candidatus Kinetoplastibacterium blastocrithidii]AFZ83842.1 crossover junction endodeoxyribonuclease RuvC [Candidatus Kinetoplastibacterium blastocrithidii (ex Strigomonas culicis)]AGF49966.1 crossover junction endodeoxyribonuclease RuvC [Candidatus Kinetoplastibacterium blastocrithidii TCC012E]
MRIIGIDPGLRKTGFGVIEQNGNVMKYIASGTIIIPTNVPLSERLKVIFDNINQVIRETNPLVAAMEIIFMNTNPATTLLLGQARGAALCAIANNNIKVYEYTALQIKKAVVGTGRAAKNQVQTMVQRLLSLNGLPSPDSADALSCAICHSNINPFRLIMRNLQNSNTIDKDKTIKKGRLI